MQVVDQHKIEPAQLGRGAAYCAAQQRRRLHGGISEQDAQPGQLAGRRHGLLRLVIVHELRTQTLRVDAALSRQEAHSPLVAVHLQRADDDASALPRRSVAGEVQEQRRLADARTRRHDDQVARLEAAHQRVDGAEPGPHRELRTSYMHVAYLPKRIDGLRDRNDPRLARLAGDGLQERLGTAQHRVQLRAAGVRHADHLGARGDQQPVRRVALDDAGVVLDTDGRRQVGDEPGEPRDAAAFVQFSSAGQLVRDGDLVDGFVAFPERFARLEGPAVGVVVEVAGGENVRANVHRRGIDEQRRDHAGFGLGVVWRRLVRHHSSTA